MSALGAIAAALLTAVALAAVARLARRGGDRLTAAFVALAALLALARLTPPGLAAWLPRFLVVRPVSAVVVIDRPPATPNDPELARLTAQLATIGAKVATVVDLGPTGTAGGPGRAASPDEALRQALGDLVAESTAGRWWSVVAGHGARVVVAVTDPRRWDGLTPIDVGKRLAEARSIEAVIDRVDLDPRRRTADLTIEAPLGVLAGGTASASRSVLSVAVRSPKLAAPGLAGRAARVTLAGTLYPDARGAALPARDYDATVLSTGEVVVRLPVGDFRDAPASPAELKAGYLRCDLEATVRVGALDVAARGVAYLPVRRARVVIVGGTNDGGIAAARLLAPRPPTLKPDPVGADEPATLRARAAALKTARAAEAADYDFITPDAFRAELAGPGPLPMAAVLCECGPTFWADGPAMGRLLGAVKDGLHLLVADPPTPPVSNDVGTLLPALTKPDARFATAPGAAPAPATADRTPILNVAFDASGWTAFTAAPGRGATAPLADGLEVQLTAANAMLAELTDAAGARLLPGRFEIVVGRRIKYRSVPGSPDRMLLRVAPQPRAQNAVADQIFGGSLELRLAGLFAEPCPSLVEPPPSGADPTGIFPAISCGEYPSGDPLYTPSQALVVFNGDVPQPNDTAPYSAEVNFEPADATAARPAKAPRRDILSRLLLRGVVTAVVRCDQAAYRAGLNDLPAHWPGPGPNPLATFTVELSHLLLAAEQRTLNYESGAWLTKQEARARLLKGAAGSPFFGTLEMSDPQVITNAQLIGKKLGLELRPLFLSPSSAMAAAATEPGRLFDERIGPGLTEAELTDPAVVASRWLADERRAAPRRFRRLEPSPTWDAAATAVYATAHNFTGMPVAAESLRLCVGGVLGRGTVAVLGYSPFEGGEPWLAPRDRIGQPDATAVDHFGPQRVIDLATFAARLVPPPLDRPRVRAVREVDGRGGVELTVDFREADADDAAFWRPALRAAGGGERALTLRRVDWDGRTVLFGLAPDDARALCATGDAAVVPVLVGRADDGAAFVLRRPDEHAWSDTPSLATLDALAAFSGGVVGGVDDLHEFGRPARAAQTLALAAALVGVAAARGRWRWKTWRRDRSRGTPPARRIDAAGLAEEYGQLLAAPRSGRRGPLDSRGPIRPDDRLDHVRRNSLLLFLLENEGMPEVDRRLPSRATRFEIIVDLGGAARVCRGPGGERVAARFAGQVAQVLAELAWAPDAGAAVRLVGLGVTGAPLSHGPFFGGRRPDEFVATVVDWAARPRGPAADPARLDIEPGAHVFWISDFLDADLSGDDPDAGLGPLLRWGAAAAESDGRFAALRATVPEEFGMLGLAFAGQPPILIDRVGLSPADLRAATQAQVERLARVFARAGLPFAEVNAEMTGQTLIETLFAAGVLTSG